MKTQSAIKAFEEYLEQGLKIIEQGDSNFKDLLLKIREQFNNLEKNIPDTDLFASVFFVLINENEKYKKKIREVTSSYDDVLGLITHEFKNLLTSIHGYNMLLEKHLENAKDDESLMHLKDSDRLTRQLFDMTDSLLKMSLGEKGLITPEFKLVDFVEDIFVPIHRDLETLLKNNKMQIKFKHDTHNLIIECDEGLMDIVVRNLLMNAIKYGKQNTIIDVAIDRTQKNFRMAVKNYSNYIPADLCKGIFDKFRSRKIGNEKGGTGIGLYNVKNIIKLHNGTITCKCSGKNWIEFNISIPQKIYKDYL
jgi:hypothetical protein